MQCKEEEHMIDRTGNNQDKKKARSHRKERKKEREKGSERKVEEEPQEE
jgi:hypothetical protein